VAFDDIYTVFLDSSCIWSLIPATIANVSLKLRGKKWSLY